MKKTILLSSIIGTTLIIGGCESSKQYITDDEKAQDVVDVGEGISNVSRALPFPYGTIGGVLGTLLMGWRNWEGRQALKDAIENSDPEEVEQIKNKVRKSKTRKLIDDARRDTPGNLTSL